ILKPMGRLREAIATQRRALELDPLNARIWSGLGFSLSMNGEQGPAREAFERSLEISPEQSFTPYNASITFLVEGRPAEALVLSQRSTEESFRLAGAALALHDLGRAVEAQQALDRLIASSGYQSAYQIAQIYAWRGDKDRAFEWLERAAEQRDGGLNNAKVDQLLVKLRGDPRHAALLKKLGLPL